MFTFEASKAFLFSESFAIPRLILRSTNNSLLNAIQTNESTAHRIRQSLHRQVIAFVLEDCKRSE
jgi:hypothetical protein